MARLDPPKGSESVSSKEWSAIARFSLRVESITVKNFSRFTHSRPFQKSTFHTTCSGNVTGAGNFLSLVYSAREWKGEGKRKEGRSGVSSVATRTIPSRFSSENMYEVTRKEAMPRFHERVARKLASTRFSFFPFFAFFRLAKKKKRKEAKFNVERRRTESERTGRKFARFPDCGCHSSRVPLDGPLDSSGNPMDEWRASVNERGPAWNGRDFFFFFFSFSSHCSPHSHIN